MNVFALLRQCAAVALATAWLASAAHGAAALSITAGCAQPRTPEAFEAAYTEATVQRHSLPALTCAAAMSAAAAGRKPSDADLQVLALDAQINLLEQIQLQLDSQTYQGGDAFEDLKARWALGIRQGKALSVRLEKPAQNAPMIAGLRMAFDLVSVSSSLVAPAVAYKVASSAISPLGDLLQKDPRLLNGIGEAIMGRLYYQLPETAGGDLDKAALHLQRANQINPQRIVFQRWYAETLVAVGRKEEARQVLARMNALGTPEPIDRQSYADELRAGIGLAERAGDPSLSEQLTAKRKALLKSFPELKTRAPAAISGHGGADPMTGKPVE
jgi:hypothetical protein